MSKEVFQMLQSISHPQLEIQLILQCAPLLAGLKISNLLITRKEYEEDVLEIFADTGIAVYKLYENEEKMTLFLYQEENFSDYMISEKARHFLHWMGYEPDKPEKIVEHFASRYRHYMQGGRDFPHEMGLLLGYPTADVYGFVIHRGKNFLYSGYWKVYDDLPETLERFQAFDRAKEKMIRMVSAGAGIRQILRMNHYSIDQETAI